MAVGELLQIHLARSDHGLGGLWLGTRFFFVERIVSVDGCSVCDFDCLAVKRLVEVVFGRDCLIRMIYY